MCPDNNTGIFSMFQACRSCTKIGEFSTRLGIVASYTIPVRHLDLPGTGPTSISGYMAQTETIFINFILQPGLVHCNVQGFSAMPMASPLKVQTW